MADTELLRAKGGGIAARPATTSLAEAPGGRGRTAQPGGDQPGDSGPRHRRQPRWPPTPLELGVLGEPQANLSMQGTVPQSNGTAGADLRSGARRPVELDAPDHAADQPAVLRHQRAGDQHAPPPTPASSRASPRARRSALNFNNNHQSLNSLQQRATIRSPAPAWASPSRSRCCAASARASTAASSASPATSRRSPACCSSSSSSPRSTA